MLSQVALRISITALTIAVGIIAGATGYSVMVVAPFMVGMLVLTWKTDLPEKIYLELRGRKVGPVKFIDRRR